MQSLKNLTIEYMKSCINAQTTTLYRLGEVALNSLPTVNMGGYYRQYDSDSLAERDIAYWMLTKDKYYYLFGKKNSGFDNQGPTYTSHKDYKDKRNFHNALIIASIKHIVHSEFFTLNQLRSYDTTEEPISQIEKVLESLDLELPGASDSTQQAQQNSEHRYDFPQPTQQSFNITW